jgi:hypothetical protein
VLPSGRPDCPSPDHGDRFLAFYVRLGDSTNPLALPLAGMAYELWAQIGNNPGKVDERRYREFVRLLDLAERRADLDDAGLPAPPRVRCGLTFGGADAG